MPLKNTLAILLLVLSAVGRLAVSAEQTEPSNTTLLPAFFTAIRNGDLDGMKQILKEHPEQIHARDERGWTPLMFAAFYADADCVRFCIENGAEVNTKNQFGATAMHYAVSDLAKVRMLIDAHADVNVMTELGNTPLILAARNSSSAAIVRLLLDNRADGNARNAGNETAITVASSSGDVESVRLLLARCADSERLKKSADEGLVYAMAGGHVDVAELLLNAGADPNGRPLFDTPMLSFAAAMNQLRIARLLLDRGADVDGTAAGLGGTPSDGGTPIVWAAENEDGDDRLVKLLLSRGADVNIEFGNHWGPQMSTPYTSIMVARRRGQSGVMKALAAAGATEVTDPWDLERNRRKLRRKVHPKNSTWSDKRVAAVTSAIPLLEKSAIESLQEFDLHVPKCVSCHNQLLPLVAINSADAKGIPHDKPRWIELSRQIPDRSSKDAELCEPTLGFGPGASSEGYIAWAMQPHWAKSPNLSADAAVHSVAMFQLADGSWAKMWPRRPMVGSQVTETALGIRTLAQNLLPGRRAEMEDKILRARRWLTQKAPRNTEEHAYKLLGLHWAGETQESLGPLADEIVRMQRTNGGWAQLPGLESDAYATGQVLYALQEAGGRSHTDSSIARGLQFLIDDQCADDSWFVRRRAYPLQPTMDPKFPHGRDAWISAAGTSWAVMALTVGLEKREVADVLSRNKELAVPRPYVQPKKE